MKIAYIRPRQDLSIATLAGILNVWTAEYRDFGLFPVISSKTGKPELRIYVYGGIAVIHGAIESACKWAGRRPEDFKIVEGDWDPKDYLLMGPHPSYSYDDEFEEEDE